jgi:two-component system nitrogen regulation sensor histidine kinase NtrY
MTLNDKKKRKDERLKNRLLLVFLIISTFLLFLSVGIFRRPSMSFSNKYISNTVLVYAILYFNILLLVGFLLMLFRNITRLIQERSRKVPGFRFSMRLIIIFAFLTLVPTLFLFVIASDFISANVDQWFSQPVEVIHQNSSRLITEIINEDTAKAKSFAIQISDLIYNEGLLKSKDYLFTRIKEVCKNLKADVVHFFFKSDKPVEPVYADKANEEIIITFPHNKIENVMKGEPFLYYNIFNGRVVVSSGFPLYKSSEDKMQIIGAVVVSLILPETQSAMIQQSQHYYNDYMETKKLKVNIKSSNILLLSMITLILLFSATWLGLRLAREITEPIQKLVEGTNQISAGNLNYRVDVQAGDELQILVDSFNRMSEELQISKQKNEESSFHLQQSHSALERQYNYIETILRDIPAGIISVDADGKINTINQAAANMLSFDESSVMGVNFQTLMRGHVYHELRIMLDTVHKKKHKTLSKIMEIRPSQELKKIAVICSPLRGTNESYLGSVMVIEDLTELSRAQKLAAWREVARRIAHEIKNPLTPIQLSAQRLKKKVETDGAGLGEAKELVEECSDTILEEVFTLKRLVDEFSLFARMPEVNLVKYQLNTVVKSSVTAYDGNTNGIQINLRLGKLPQILIDPEQMKRVIRNLLENALEAMEGMASGKIEITTCMSATNGVELVVADEGVGINKEDMDKIFVPYFSGKKKGTGLGLAIVSKIVSDHGGKISVSENTPRGAMIVIHLPRGG